MSEYQQRNKQCSAVIGVPLPPSPRVAAPLWLARSIILQYIKDPGTKVAAPIEEAMRIELMLFQARSEEGAGSALGSNNAAAKLCE